MLLRIVIFTAAAVLIAGCTISMFNAGYCPNQQARERAAKTGGYCVN